MGAKGTLVYARLHSGGPTLAQQSAIDLLVVGKTDTEVAAALGLARTTVSKWRAYDLAFQAALNARRAEVWGPGRTSSGRSSRRRWTPWRRNWTPQARAG